MTRVRKLALTLAPVLAAWLATPALANEGVATRLVSCGAQSCLMVAGHRPDSGAIVRINGHAVDVEGKRNWQVRLPIATVRDWSAPFARKIEVSYHDISGQTGMPHHARLPIGLLGHVPDLASLIITLN